MNKKTFLTIICIFVVFFLLKTFFSNTLFINSTYGIPALVQTGAVDNLFIGSSMFRQGLDIQTIDENLSGKKNYILAYNGNQPALEYYQLKYLIEQNVKIDNLYLDMYVYSAWEEPALSDEKLFLEFDISTKQQVFDIIQKEHLIKDWWQLWVSNNNEMILFWPIYSFIINTQFNNGGALNFAANASEEQLNNQKVHTISGPMNYQQKEYLNKIIDLTEEHGIHLVFIETPKYETVQNDHNYQNAVKEYSDFLEARGIDVILSQDTFENHNHMYFQDTIHLSSEGRKAYTELLCGQINYD